MEPVVKQKILGSRGLMALIVFLSAFIPLSTDLYLPALPGMAVSFGLSAELMNLTILFFFVFYALGTLVWGPLSDKYGRKIVLLSGIALYTAASLVCALSGSYAALLIGRIFQAAGCGAAPTVSLAIIRDTYEGRKRETVLALVQSISMFSPIVAPVIGAFLLSVSSWHGIFWMLFAFGILALLGSLLMTETIRGKNTGLSILRTFSRLGAVAKNPRFLTLLVIFSLGAIPLMAFITGSSYIYIGQFGLSEQAYSYYFSANAVFLLLGPLIYMVLRNFLKAHVILVTGFAVAIAAGILVACTGSAAPWLFALTFVPVSLVNGVFRPIGVNLMLNQQPYHDTGSASSLMSCAFTAFNCVGILAISPDWADRVLVIGLITIAYAVISLLLWLFFSGKYDYIGYRAPEEADPV